MKTQEESTEELTDEELTEEEILYDTNTDTDDKSYHSDIDTNCVSYEADGEYDVNRIHPQNTSHIVNQEEGVSEPCEKRQRTGTTNSTLQKINENVDTVLTKLESFEEYRANHNVPEPELPSVEYWETVRIKAEKYRQDEEIIKWFMEEVDNTIFTQDEKMALLYARRDVALRYLYIQRNEKENVKWKHNRYWLRGFIDMTVEILDVPDSPQELAYLHTKIRNQKFAEVEKTHEIKSNNGEQYARFFPIFFPPKYVVAGGYQVKKLRSKKKGHLDPSRYKRSSNYSTGQSGTVYHAGIWRLQGNHKGPAPTKFSSAMIEFINSPAIQKLEQIKRTYLRCAEPDKYAMYMKSREYFDKKWYKGKIWDKQTVPCMGINYNYLCGSHIDKDDWLQCYLLILGEVEPGEGAVGAADLLTVFKVRSGSMLQLQSKKIRHWVTDMHDPDKPRISIVDFAHTRQVLYTGTNLKDHEFKIYENDLERREMWKQVCGRVFGNNRYINSEKRFLEAVRVNANLSDDKLFY